MNNNFNKNRVDYLDKFDTNDAAQLRAFIIAVFDGVWNTEDSVGFDDRDLKMVDKIRKNR